MESGRERGVSFIGLGGGGLLQNLTAVIVTMLKVSAIMMLTKEPCSKLKMET